MEQIKLSDLKYTCRVLKEMCKIAKVDYSKVKFNKPDWFLKHSCDEKQQDKFRKWMIKYLKTNKKAREEIMSIPIKDTKRIKKTVDWFIFQYFWRTDNGKTD